MTDGLSSVCLFIETGLCFNFSGSVFAASLTCEVNIITEIFACQVIFSNFFKKIIDIFNLLC